MTATVRQPTVYSRIILRIVAGLPPTITYSIAVILGDLHYRFKRRRRDDVLEGLQTILDGMLTPSKRVAVTKEFIRLRYCELLDEILTEQDPRALLDLTEIRGRTHLDSALNNGKGVILVTGHYGSVRAIFAILGAMKYPISVVAKWSIQDYNSESVRTRAVNRLLGRRSISALVSHPNINIAENSLASAYQTAAYLKKNEVVIILIDAAVLPDDAKNAMTVQFLGKNVLFKPGAVTISKLLGSPILATFLQRGPDYRHQVLEISAPIPVVEVDDTLRRCLKMVETEILRHPSHWQCWTHRHLSNRGMVPR